MVTYLLEVSLEWAEQLTKRPRHLEAAIYHQQRATLLGQTPPPGCRLHIIPARGNRAMRLGVVTLLLAKDAWDKGHIPPLTPREEAAMRGEPVPARKKKTRRTVRKPLWAEGLIETLLAAHPIYRRAPLLPQGILVPEQSFRGASSQFSMG